MPERELIDQKARAFFDEMWKGGDPWKLETSDFEQDKYTRQLALLEGRRFADVLEIGCGAGFFTRRLSQIADRVLGLDISANAIAQAQQTKLPSASVEFQVANIMDYDVRRSGPWDLIVMSETICYLGWLYSFFDVAWFASELFAATREGGRLLMANTCGGVEDYLLRPWIIRTYRDLLLNVGYALDAEEIFRGQKNGAEIEVLISLLTRPPSE
jgi:predicted TPR repeat methyltransferase